MHADIRDKLAKGQDSDVIAAWEELEQLDLDIAKRIQMLKPE